MHSHAGPSSAPAASAVAPNYLPSVPTSKQSNSAATSTLAFANSKKARSTPFFSPPPASIASKKPSGSASALNRITSVTQQASAPSTSRPAKTTQPPSPPLPFSTTPPPATPSAPNAPPSP